MLIFGMCLLLGLCLFMGKYSIQTVAGIRSLDPRYYAMMHHTWSVRSEMFWGSHTASPWYWFLKISVAFAFFFTGEDFLSIWSRLVISTYRHYLLVDIWPWPLTYNLDLHSQPSEEWVSLHAESRLDTTDRWIDRRTLPSALSPWNATWLIKHGSLIRNSSSL